MAKETCGQQSVTRREEIGTSAGSNQPCTHDGFLYAASGIQIRCNDGKENGEKMLDVIAMDRNHGTRPCPAQENNMDSVCWKSSNCVFSSQRPFLHIA
jgi:hypothetical protein